MAFTAGDLHVVRRANPALLGLVNRPPGAVTGRPVAEVFGTPEGGALTSLLDGVRRTGVPDLIHEVPHPLPGGGAGWCTVWARPADDLGAGESGLAVYAMDTSGDVEARRREARRTRDVRDANEALLLASLREQRMAEEAVRQADQLNALLASLTEGVIIADEKYGIVLINPVGQHLLGLGAFPDLEAYDRCDLETKEGQALGPGEDPVRRALYGAPFADVEFRRILPEGVRRLLFSGSAAPRAEAGSNMAIAVFRDVTEIRRLEATRRDFVALISHDLRSPLTAIVSKAYWLRHMLQGLGMDRETAGASTIIRSARQMALMIQDLVESTYLESGQAEMQFRPTDLVELVADIAQRVGTEQDRARISLDVAGPIPPVRADPDRLERALVNLITNALKYSPPDAPVSVGLRVDGGTATVTVADRGVGIPADEIPHVFEKFRRARTGLTSEGLGLGLYITRLIAQAHRGSVGVESEPGKGSAFHLRLPLAEGG